jgi:biopolymer transport protein ExbD
MPIQFRCSTCQQLLSISRRKAGQQVFCPSCTAVLQVPTLEQAQLAMSATLAEFQIPPELLYAPAIEAEDEAAPLRVKRRQFSEDGLDMTPMVDVTFQLLIFFMLTAAFATQKSLETSAPEPESEGAAQALTMEELESESVVVTIGPDSQMLVDDVPVSGLAALRDALAGKLSGEQKTEVLIEADYQARHGAVVAVTSAAIDVGMQRVRRVSQRDGE